MYLGETCVRDGLNIIDVKQHQQQQHRQHLLV